MSINLRVQVGTEKLLNYLSQLPKVELTERDWTYLQPLQTFHKQIQSTHRSAVILGVFKAGKSTLINALIGKSLLPARTNRATGVLTRISYADKATAWIISGDEQTFQIRTEVSSDQISDYILLDISNGGSVSPEGIREVELCLPLPLFQASEWSLVDTPGLLDDPVLSSVTYNQLEQSDLAIVVLQADKLLGETEREAICKINALLKGNVIVVVNRLDQIDIDERQSIIDWATSALEGIGNRLVGYPSLFTVSAKELLQESTSKISNSNQSAFYHFLNTIFHSPLGERVSLLSRLGILEYRIQEAKTYFQLQLIDVQQQIQKLEWEAQEDFKQRQNNFAKSVENKFTCIVELCNEFNSQLESIQSSCLIQAKILINTDNKAWVTELRLNVIKELIDYSDKILKATFSVFEESEISTPSLCWEISEICNAIQIQTDLTTTLSQLTDSTKVMKFGRWIANVWGGDPKNENYDAAQCFIQKCLIIFKENTDQFTQGLFSCLEDFGNTHQPILHTPLELELARQYKVDCERLIAWIDVFYKKLKPLMEEIVSLRSQFNEQWERFLSDIFNQFESEHSLCKAKKRIDNKLLINELINIAARRWYNNLSYETIWLNKLITENKEKGEEFEVILKSVSIISDLEKESLVSKLESAIVLTTLSMIAFILFGGQNPRSLNITAQRIAISTSLVGIAIYSFQCARRQRHERFTIKLRRDIKTDLNVYKYQLHSILESFDQTYQKS